MDVLRFGPPSGSWSGAAYSIKVRGLKYLWGSAGLTADLAFDEPFILYMANDQSGEPVKIGTRVAAGRMTDLGTIQPGECVSVEINGISGVYADCGSDTVVHCTIY